MNLKITPEFEKQLTLFMKKRKITQKSDAIRIAVSEAIARIYAESAEQYDFAKLRGIALKAPLNNRPRFQTDDDLWS